MTENETNLVGMYVVGGLLLTALAISYAMQFDVSDPTWLDGFFFGFIAGGILMFVFLAAQAFALSKSYTKALTEVPWDE
ncbi:hypothetical protein OB905_13085 [Halobacteria archaeon AArc-dxtr1]|nr:hypothetical protein [Halobacteria archaeon AArc-dxtr1]